jgi:hypothetical protein
MRVFIAATCPYLLKCVQRAFRYVPVTAHAYVSTVQSPGSRMFRTVRASASEVACLVHPCDAAVSLRLEQMEPHKYILTCPPATTNLRVLCRQVLRFLAAQAQQFHIVILPSELWGDALPPEEYADALCCAYLDVHGRREMFCS